MNTTPETQKEQYDTPSVTDIEPVSIVTGDNGGSPVETLDEGGNGGII